MAIKNKLNIFNGSNLKDGGNAIIKDPKKPTVEPVSNFEQLQNAANNLTTKPSGMPTSAWEQMQGTYTPQLLTPVEATNTNLTPKDVKTSSTPISVAQQPTNSAITPSERLKEIADKSITRYDDNGNGEVVKPASSDKAIVKYPEETPSSNNGGSKIPEPSNGDSGATYTWNDIENYVKDALSNYDVTTSDAYKNAMNERDSEYNDLLAKYDNLYNTKVTQFNNEANSAWNEQKDRINQAALNYQQELDAINKKSSMYYDNLLKQLGLYGSGAGAGAYTDMAAQNANAAMKIEENRQNQIEQVRQANTEKLLDMVERYRQAGATDEEIEQLTQGINPEALTADAAREVDRIRGLNKAEQRAKAEAEAKEQSEEDKKKYKDNLDRVLSLYSSLELDDSELEKYLTDNNINISDEDKAYAALVREIAKKTDEATKGKESESKNDEVEETMLGYLSEANNRGLGANVEKAIEDVFNRTDLSLARKSYEAAKILNDPTSIPTEIDEKVADAKENANNVLNKIGAKVTDDGIKASNAVETTFGDYNGTGKKGDTQYVWANGLIELAKNGKIPNGTLVDFNVGYGSAAWYIYQGGYWFKTDAKTTRDNQTNQIGEASIDNVKKHLKDLSGYDDEKTNTLVNKYM